MTTQPTMPEYAEKVREGFRIKLARMSASEREQYIPTVTAMAREAAEISGAPITEDFLLGCLFATSAISVGVVMLHRAHIISHEVMDHMVLLAKEQEFVCYGIVRGTP